MGKLNLSMKACGVFLLWAAIVVGLSAQTTAVAPIVTFTTLHNFDGTDGADPKAGLVQGTNGDLYGTTEGGGANAACYRGATCGTVFKITPSGTLTNLYSFCSQTGCADGEGPYGGLVQATNGNFYGTTSAGGANGDYGTVFKITPSGTLTTLHSFDVTDGESPLAGLIQGMQGDFYGTTEQGGANGGYGTVFKITPGGTLTTLHSFDGTDGFCPCAGLVQGANGHFYGTTEEGGANGYNGDGTVYKITPSGTLTTLHSFDGTDGFYPAAALVQGTDGHFYGTTQGGGAHGDGTVYKITPSGTLTTLHSFDYAEGYEANGALVRGTDGNFYGTTIKGGASGGGTVFKITPGGTLTTLHSFDGTDGARPEAALVQDTNGTFYGTTFHGGANGYGTIFSLSVGLGPFVETQPTSGKVGKAVTILGTSLTGATSVTFNGTPATFTVKSKSEITTAVPLGATTGTVQVVTPGGTLSSNVPFRVTP
jgi:uncharacterized repeat protein (TIGR03803 family)